MKRLVLALCAAIAATSALASPESDYILARDRHIDKIRNLEENDQLKKVGAVEKTARADLERRLAALIGPVSVDGIPAKGKLNMESCRRARSASACSTVSPLRRATPDRGSWSRQPRSSKRG